MAGFELLVVVWFVVALEYVAVTAQRCILAMDCLVVLDYARMHILSDVEHQRCNHSVASLRCHVSMLRVVIDCNDCCANCNSTSSYQQPRPPLAALGAPPCSFGCGIGRLICLACKCPRRPYSACEGIVPRRGASLLPQAISLGYRLSLRSYTSSADPRPSEERRRKGAQGRHYVYTMAGRVQSLQSLWA